MITEEAYDYLCEEFAADEVDELPEIRWLSELQSQCNASTASVAGQRMRQAARINVCVAAHSMCGGAYGDPERDWFDALQDLIAKQKEMRRWHNTTEGWAREDGEFFDRVNHSIRSWNERFDEPEEEDEMPRTVTVKRQARRRQKATKETKAADRETMNGIPETQAAAADKEAEASGVETFNEWRRPIVKALAGNESKVREYNDQLLELYHDGVSAADALVHVLHSDGPLPDPDQVLKPTDASTHQPVHSSTHQDLSVDLIELRDDNPRSSIEDADLQLLARAIQEDGLQQPIVVAPHPLSAVRYQVWQGECRFRAVRDVLEHKTIRCRIDRASSPAQLAHARMLENEARSNLNPIDQARGYRDVLDKTGCTQAQLAKDVGLSAGELNNRLRLLDLPKTWQERIISGEVPPGHARFVAPWAAEKAVLKEIEARIKYRRRWRHDNPYGSQEEFHALVGRAVKDVSRPMSGEEFIDGRGYVKVALTKSQKADERLDIRTVKLDGKSEQRAFNTKLWDSWNGARKKELEEKRARREASAKKKAKAEEETLTPAEKRERTKKRQEQWAKKLYRYKLSWLVERIVSQIDEGQIYDHVLLKLLLHYCCAEQPDRRGHLLGQSVVDHGGHAKKVQHGYTNMDDVLGTLATVPIEELPAVARTCLTRWLRETYEGYRAMTPPRDIEAIAADLGIDFATEWEVDEAFLQLHSREQLLALNIEWQLPVQPIGKRGELINAMLAAATVKQVKAPKSLTQLKPVSLL